ncbi:hypothetical protein AJ80_00277 [Polytolypa hystricis UAMH7299]|uniref:ABC a-pheromone efflux pump AtrD n=1 Tax=Polytolypa hystricis (strain UAMH7299) TaxID=1447883 RepID=A0A2B7Z4Q1_POLH7|nr:hypothetical protein AJ80_00277 [Polytolypa hystricis UAMH7299]
MATSEGTEVIHIEVASVKEPCQKPQWRSLFHFTTRKHFVPLFLAMFFTVASGVMSPMLALVLGRVFDAFTIFASQSIAAEELMSRISNLCIYLMGLGAILWALQSGFFCLWIAFGELQAQSARTKLFAGLLKKDIEWLEMREDGVTALLPRLQTQIRDLQLATAQPFGYVLQNSFGCAAALGLAFYTSWKLTLVSLASIPICAVIVAFLSNKIQPNIRGHDGALSNASKLATNSLSSIDVVKCFNGQDFEVKQYAGAVRSAASWYINMALFKSLEIGCVQLMIFIMFVQGFWYGSSLVSSGELTPGEVLTCFWACLQASHAIEVIMPQIIVLEKGRSAGTALKEILEDVRKQPSTPTVSAIAPMFCDGDIHIKNVTFAYPSRPDCYVLKDASFFFPAGDTTFVVGRSGSGKSTLSNLLMRFYAPTTGTISIDGNLLENLETDWIRNNITLVQQKSVLFNESIFKNIALGARNHDAVKKEEILACIDFASLYDTICSLPIGLDTVVGVGGNGLSGGQRQRVAIARARLRDTPILILDECTSALDYTTRTAVMDAIRAWRKGKTTIIITHDTSQINGDDFVYVLEQGVVIHKGYNKKGLKTEDASLFMPPMKYLHEHRLTFPAASPLSSRYQAAISGSQPRSTPSSSGPEVDAGLLSSPLSPMFHHRLSFYEISPFRTMFQSQAQSSPAHDQFEAPRRMSLPSLTDIEKSNLDGAIILDDGMSVGRSMVSTPTESDFDFEAQKSRMQLKDQQYSSIFAILRTVVPSLMVRDRILLILGFVAALCHAAATPTFAYCFSQLLGTFIITHNQSQSALTWSVALIAVSIVNAVGCFSMHYLLERCGQAWVDTLRYESMRRILRQPKEWFDRDENRLSILNMSLDRNPEEMRNLVGRFAGYVLVAAVIMIMSITWGVVMCWKLALVGLSCAPVLYGFTRGFERVSGKWENRCNDAGEVISGIFSETFLDIRTIRALTLESYFHNKLQKANSQTLKLGFKRACYSGFFYGLSDSSILFVYTLVFYYGAVLASTLTYSTKTILTVFSMLLFGMSNVNAVLTMIPQISSSRDTGSRVLRFASLPDDTSHEHKGKLRIQHPAPILFKGVNFSYPSRQGKVVLQDFTLTIPEYKCTTIVGPSGSGKSTIASLLLSLYPTSSEADSGTISLCGQDIRTLHVPTLRYLISTVPQQPTLFPTSIRANISYGLDASSPLNTFETIQAAATAAGIHDFIISLPDGYETVIGDNSIGLSGGQAQRLVIARALIRRPRILVLDEATSNLDAESAKVVRETVMRLMESSEMKTTVVIITHAREMMQISDKVVVVDGGRVVEEGAYGALMGKTGGELRRLLMEEGEG